jgi:hypothetical protein
VNLHRRLERLGVGGRHVRSRKSLGALLAVEYGRCRTKPEKR